jgi:hypothetical protein
MRPRSSHHGHGHVRRVLKVVERVLLVHGCNTAYAREAVPKHSAPIQSKTSSYEQHQTWKLNDFLTSSRYCRAPVRGRLQTNRGGNTGSSGLLSMPEAFTAGTDDASRLAMTNRRC